MTLVTSQTFLYGNLHLWLSMPSLNRFSKGAVSRRKCYLGQPKPSFNRPPSGNA